MSRFALSWHVLHNHDIMLRCAQASHGSHNPDTVHTIMTRFIQL